MIWLVLAGMSLLVGTALHGAERSQGPQCWWEKI